MFDADAKTVIDLSGTLEINSEQPTRNTKARKENAAQCTTAPAQAKSGLEWATGRTYHVLPTHP